MKQFYPNVRYDIVGTFTAKNAERCGEAIAVLGVEDYEAVMVAVRTYVKQGAEVQVYQREWVETKIPFGWYH